MSFLEIRIAKIPKRQSYTCHRWLCFSTARAEEKFISAKFENDSISNAIVVKINLDAFFQLVPHIAAIRMNMKNYVRLFTVKTRLSA